MVSIRSNSQVRSLAARWRTILLLASGDGARALATVRATGEYLFHVFEEMRVSHLN